MLGLANPVDVHALTAVGGLAAGSNFTCALDAAGTVACWGAGSSGELEPAANHLGSLVPVQVSGLSHVVAISAGRHHACALKDDGSVLCWGSNPNSQSGAASVAHDMARPVPGQTGVAMLSTGYFNTCSRDFDLAFRCWGSISCGESDATGAALHDVVQPTWMAGLQGAQVREVAAGGNEFLCALLGDGTARCVGR